MVNQSDIETFLLDISAALANITELENEFMYQLTCKFEFQLFDNDNCQAEIQKIQDILDQNNVCYNQTDCWDTC